VDPVSRAKARLFLFRVDHDWYRSMNLILAGGKEVAAAQKQLRDSLMRSAPIFSAKPFFMSDELGLVDCSIVPLLWRLPALGVELPSQAKPVEAYAERMFKREAFSRSLTEVEREMRG